jgi:hypothetical protein
MVLHEDVLGTYTHVASPDPPLGWNGLKVSPELGIEGVVVAAFEDGQLGVEDVEGFCLGQGRQGREHMFLPR